MHNQGTEYGRTGTPISIILTIPPYIILHSRKERHCWFQAGSVPSVTIQRICCQYTNGVQRFGKAGKIESVRVLILSGPINQGRFLLELATPCLLPPHVD